MGKRKPFVYSSTVLLLMGLFLSLVVPARANFINVLGDEITPTPEIEITPTPVDITPTPAEISPTPTEVVLGFTTSPDAASLQAAGDPFSLTLDFGKKIFLNRMCSTRASTQVITWNRFTPAAENFPFSIDQVSMLVDSLYQPGDPVQVLIYQDPDGNIDNGAELLRSQYFSVQYNDSITWNEFNLEEPVELVGPGDVLVGAVIRKTVVDASTQLVCPAYLDVKDSSDAADDDTYQARSYIGGYSDGVNGINPPDLPAMPPNEYALTEKSDGTNVVHGNLLIRAKGIAGPLNHRPVADNQTVSATEDTPVGVTLTGSDPDANPITYSLIAGPTKGVLTGDMPNLTYTPNLNANGQDSFSFKTFDGKLESKTPATVTINIAPVNDLPVASDQSFTTDEDVGKGITLGVNDVDGDSLSYTVVTTPLHGTLSGTGPVLFFTPESNYFGPDSFTFKANDGAADSNTATVSIGIYAVNDRPVADGKSAVTAEDTPTTVTLSGSDVEGSALTYNITTSPAHGTLSGIFPQLTYTPAANYNGPDEFAYTVSDGQLISEFARVSISVLAVNDAPVANSQSVVTDEDTSKPIALYVSDVDGDPLTYTITVSPSQGSLSGTAPNLTYIPRANLNGSDSFTFKVNDGMVDSNSATVNITINPINDRPTADGKSIVTAEDTPAKVTLSGSDVEGSALTYSILTNPTHGVLSGTFPDQTYTPAANYYGPDEFTYTVGDGTLVSDVARVSILVTAVNDAPVVNSQAITTDEDIPKSVLLTASDVDGDALSYSIVDNPTNGSLSGTAPYLTYTPAENYNGADSFTFRVNDGTVNSSTATVSITINAVNDKPVAYNKSVSTDEDTAATITLTGFDVEGTPLTFNVITGPYHGTLSGTGSTRVYTPAPDYYGTDTFTYRATDGLLTSDNAVVNIAVKSVNDAPVAYSQSVSTNEDTARAIILSSSDVDGDLLTYTLISNPQHGTLIGTAPYIIYSPAANYNGPDSFTFRVNDGALNSNIATVSIGINPVNDRPTVSNRSVATDEDVALPITLSGSDVEGSPLTFNIIAGPYHGTLSGSVPNLTYTPAPNYYGSDSFVYNVYDGELFSGNATVSLAVKSINDAPVVSGQSVTTDEDTPKSIVLAASDVDGDALTFTIVTAPAHGTINGSGRYLVYTPAANYNGSDSFVFKASDGVLSSGTATVGFTINAVNDKPVVNARNVATDEDVSLNITLSGFDVEGTPLTFSIITGPYHGTLSGTGSTRTYTPDANYFGTDTFVYRGTDGALNSDNATVRITVRSINDAPVANSQSVNTNEDTAKAITLSASDVDGDTLTYTLVSNPLHGSLVGSVPNIIYTPDANYYGNDSFTFKVSDGTLGSSATTVSIVVSPVNDRPTASSRSVSTAEDNLVSVVLNGSDVEGSPLVYSIVTAPAHGSLSGMGSNKTYTPDADFFGVDSFTYRVYDGSLYSSNATVNITVTPVNDAPVASGQTIILDEDAPKVITLVANDVDGDSLTYTIPMPPTRGTLSGKSLKMNYTVTIPSTLGTLRSRANPSYTITIPPTNGSLNGKAPNLTYTPFANFNGTDSFTFLVNDGTLNSTTATVNISVLAVNDKPVANGLALTTDEDTSTFVTLTGSDVESNKLTFGLVSDPAHGTLNGAPPALTYTPDANYSGLDSFAYRVYDGDMYSDNARVSITVNPVNDRPVAEKLSIATAEDTPKAFLLGGSDIESIVLTYEVVKTPSRGTLSGAGANKIYTPDANYNGPDEFTYRAYDNELYSEIVPVSITVAAVNDAPVAGDQEVTTAEDTAKKIMLVAADVEGVPLSYNIEKGPAHGTLSGTAPDLTYTPNTNFNGSDSLSFTASDGQLSSNRAKINITVTTVNDAPIADAKDINIEEDATASVLLSGSDVETRTLSYELISEPAHGRLNGDPPFLTYIPELNYYGTDTFTYRVSDGELKSAAAPVNINITPVNDMPLVNGASIQTEEDTAVSFKLDASDVDGDSLALVVVSGPAHGSLSGTVDRLVYTPEAGYRGSDSFICKVNDGKADSIHAKVDIKIVPVNHAPVAIEINRQLVAEHQPVGTLVGNFSTVDPDPYDDHIYSLVSGTGDDDNASFNIVGAALYTAKELDYETSHSYSIRVRSTDLGGLSYEGVYTINLTDVNEAPKDIILRPDLVADQEFLGSTVGYLSARDPDVGDTATFSLINGVGDDDNSSFTISGNALTTAARMDIKTKPVHSVRIRAMDAGGLKFEKVITITVAEIPVTGE